MKMLIVLLLTMNLAYSDEPVSINNAPLEWLISTTLSEKVNLKGESFTKDSLVKKIYSSFEYDSNIDEMIMISSFKSNQLRNEMITFLSIDQKSKKIDPMYIKWKEESKKLSVNKIKLFRVKTKKPSIGFYYFNHIHTDISQDNSSLKWLKISPEKTFNVINKFLKRRKSEGVAAFTDHDTDRAFEKVLPLHNDRLTTLRGIEWGGKTHMCLVDIKKDWDLLNNGREFSDEESIIMSRSSEGFRIVNHPNRKTPFPYTSWLDANGVEVWNTILEGAPVTRLNIRRSNNRDAFAQWVESLKIDKTYTALAGSDFHFVIPCLRDRSLHYPANFIPMEDKSKVRDYLDQGNLSILTRPTAPKLNLTITDGFTDRKMKMGERVFGSPQKVKVNLYGDFTDVNKRVGGICYNVINTFHRLLTFWKKRTWEVRFYNKEGNVIAKKTINPKKYNYKKHFRVEFEYNIKSTDLVRAELWEINKKSQSIDLLGATNPIYFN
jgi:hypothetical protein